MPKEESVWLEFTPSEIDLILRTLKTGRDAYRVEINRMEKQRKNNRPRVTFHEALIHQVLLMVKVTKSIRMQMSPKREKPLYVKIHHVDIN